MWNCRFTGEPIAGLVRGIGSGQKAAAIRRKHNRGKHTVRRRSPITHPARFEPAPAGRMPERAGRPDSN